MIISFDLDDTLICLDEEVPKEENRIPSLLKFIYKDPLRSGTVELMQNLILNGWQIYIYTTSFRSVRYIKKLFSFYGINIIKVINQDIHDKEVIGSRKISMPSKYPSKFGINLHIDDQNSFVSDGIQFGFDVLVVNPDDLNWTEKVLTKAEQIRTRNKGKTN